MKDLINAFPSNIQQTFEIISKINIRKKDFNIQNIVICGMGGSGIGGKIVSQLVSNEIKVPIAICQDYNLPNFVNENTLVIGSSYSGNTEETLFTVKKAHEKGALIVNICSGGELMEFSKENDLDFITNPGGNPPRSAIVFSIVEQIFIMTELGLISDKILNELKECTDFLRENENQIHKTAESIAKFIEGTIPIFYSTSELEGVLVRIRQQINENSKMLCWHHTLPEMNHNELVGWAGGSDQFSVIFVDGQFDNERNKTRIDFTLNKIREKSKNIFIFDTLGVNYTQKVFYTIYTFDWTSWYLSNLNQVDVMEVNVISDLKNTLSKI